MKKFALNLVKKIRNNIRNNIRNKITNGSKRVKEINETFKKTLDETRKKPVSKRKSALLGFVTVLAIFGFTVLAPVLPVLAKDIPVSNPCPGPGDIYPSPSQAPVLNEVSRDAFAGFAGSVCGLAVTTGSLAVGVACGFVVVLGILYVQKKSK